MTQDTATNLMAQVWKLLEANTDWTVQSSNQVRYDLVQGTAPVDRHNDADGDFPRATLKVIAGSHQMFTSDETFQTFRPEGIQQWVERSQYVLQLEIISALLAISEIDSLCLEAINALRRGGPRLQLTYVTRWLCTWQQDVTDVDVENSVQRWRSRIRITIDVELQGKDLL